MQNGIHRGRITRIRGDGNVFIVIPHLTGINYEYGPMLATDSTTGLAVGTNVAVGFLEQNEATPMILGTFGHSTGASALPGGGFQGDGAVSLPLTAD